MLQDKTRSLLFLKDRRTEFIDDPRKLRFTEAGKVSQLKIIEIAVRRQGMAAVGGDLKAQRDWMPVPSVENA